MYDELLPGRQVTTALKPDQQSRWYVVDFRWTGTVAVGRLHHLDEPWREKHVLVRTPRLSADPPEMTP
ncbi:hypothetical protein [Deinococcus peraridilitoris]|nr:hypothetical protein [Deinococcus peraridilitoris]